MKAQRKVPPLEEASGVLFSCDTDDCVVSRTLLATLLDDLCRWRDRATAAEHQLAEYSLWRQGWQLYLDTMPKSLSSEIVNAVRSEKASGCSQKEIASRHGISESAVSRILHGSRHKSSMQAPIPADNNLPLRGASYSV
jgi:hypothetical protein